MNPIERASARADKIIAANRDLESMSRKKLPAKTAVPTMKPQDGRASLRGTIAGMKHNDEVKLQIGGHPWSVHYHEEQSYGDNNQPVKGATTGMYTVTHGDTGRQNYFMHGPHATTPAAARKGANPNAKGSAAGAAVDHIISRSADHSSAVFNDRRRI